jgi:peptidoglycan/LPS O-acetylase OafA/YrhL
MGFFEMGTLRTLLALSVVFAHSYGYIFVGGQNAVQLFYMISGYLISYVVVEKRSYLRLRNFYINRMLRIYPVYLLVAVLTLIALLVLRFGFNKNPEFFVPYQVAPFSANVLLVVSNISLFLQDWVMFLGTKDGALVFVNDFNKSDVVLFKGLLVPQAWTLGVELSFYLLAPFVLPRRNILFAFLGVSLCIRLYLISIGLGHKDPWTYRFFPAELALFLLGALSHQLISPLYEHSFFKKSIELYSKWATYILVLVVILFWIIPVSEFIKSFALFVIFFVTLPLTFFFHSKREWDRWIGDLSYPIYICHMLVIYFVSFLAIHFETRNAVAFCVAVLALTLGVSIALKIYFMEPIETLRSRFRVVR